MYRFSRVRSIEWMDRPGLDRTEYQAVLKGLDRIHEATRMGQALLNRISDWSPKGRTLKLVEVGAGSGHMTHWIAAGLKQAGVTAEVEATDLRPAPGVRALNCLDPSGLPEADIYFSSLMLHHLADKQVVAMLALQASKARIGLIHLDLHRNFFHYAGAWAFLRLLPGMHPINLHDAQASIQQGFSHAELTDLLGQAGLKGNVEWIFPFRWLLSWRRP